MVQDERVTSRVIFVHLLELYNLALVNLVEGIILPVFGRALEDHDNLLRKMAVTLEKQEKVMEVLTQKIMLLESHDDDNGERLNNQSYHIGCLEQSQQVGESRSNPFVFDLIHWGRGALETAENILRTLQDVVQISCNVTAKHMQRTFGM